MKIRLKPFDPNAGALKRDYTAPWGEKFFAGRWYDYDDELTEYLAYLKTVRQVNNDLNSPLAFDVVTEDRARVIRATEKMVDIEQISSSADDEAPRAPTAPVRGAKVDRGLNAPPAEHELDLDAKAAKAPAPPPPTAKKRAAKKKTTRAKAKARPAATASRKR
jgi:hypothetical protein